MLPEHACNLLYSTPTYWNKHIGDYLDIQLVTEFMKLPNTAKNFFLLEPTYAMLLLVTLHWCISVTVSKKQLNKAHPTLAAAL